MTRTEHAFIRPAVQADHRQISRLIQQTRFLHRHLDWRNPLDWVGTPPFFLIEDRHDIRAAFGCPPDPPGIGWIRLFACDREEDLQQDWESLLEATLTSTAARGNYLLAAISLQDWFETLLRSSGFSSRQSIVMLERDGTSAAETVLPPGCGLRPMMYYDLPAVADVDASAFEPLWQNTLDSLQLAFRQAILASVVESDGVMIGYQLSTRNPFGVHLARLAVRPDIQKRGIGRALVADLIEQAGRRGLARLTVNTQSDNIASLSLYKKLGFYETGERYPVYEYRSGAAGRSQ